MAPTSILQGGSYTVTIIDCLALLPPYDTSVEVINLTAGFTGFTNVSLWPETFSPTITETGPLTGTFITTIDTTGNVAESGKLHVLPNDTITVTYPFATPPTRTVTVTPDPCDTTPSAPTSLGGSEDDDLITLDWGDVTTNTDLTPITDLVGYRVYERVCKDNKPNCTGSDVVVDWFLRTSVGAGISTATVTADMGEVKHRIYYFKVTAIDSCSPPNESAASNVWNETKN